MAGPLIRPKSGTPQMLMVMLHGYGADGEDLIGLASYFADLLPETLYVAPNAPTRCGLGAGYEWFARELRHGAARARRHPGGATGQ